MLNLTKDEFITRMVKEMKPKVSYGLTEAEADALIDKGREACDFFEETAILFEYGKVFEKLYEKYKIEYVKWELENALQPSTT